MIHAINRFVSLMACIMYGALDTFGVYVMSSGDSRSRVFGQLRRGKNILPTPFIRCLGIFPHKGEGQIHGPDHVSEVLLMNLLPPFQMSQEFPNNGLSEQGDMIVAILLHFIAAYAAARLALWARLSPLARRTIICLLFISIS